MTRNPRIRPRIWDHGFVHLRSIRNALQQEGSIAEGVVLDVGCGTAPYRDLFGDGYLGVDLFPSRAPGRVGALSERLPIRDNSVDTILSTQHLEHADDPRTTLSEFARTLRVDGTLILTTHGVWPYHPDPDDYWRWTAAGLAYELRRQGFQIERIHHCGELFGAAVPLLGYPLVPLLGRGSLIARLFARLVFFILNASALAGDRLLKALRVRHLASPCFVIVATA